MKTLRHAGVGPCFLTTPLAAFLVVMGPCASHARDSNPAERLILSKLSSGELADLHTLPARDRKVRASFVEDLLTGDIRDVKVHWRGVRIRGAIFDEFVDLRGAVIPYDVQLEENEFAAGLNWSESHFMKALDVAGSHFGRAEATFWRMRVEGNGDFSRTVFTGPVDFLFASISGDLLVDGGHFGDRVSFNTLQVAGNASFKRAVFEGAVDFKGAEFARYAMFEKAHFASHERADFNNMKVKGAAQFNEVVFDGPTVFLGVEIGEELNVNDAVFSDPKATTDFTNMKVERNVILQRATFAGPVSFNFTEAGQLGMQGTKFKGPVRINSVALRELYISKDVIFDKSLSIQDAYLKSAYVGLAVPPQSLALDHLRYDEIDAGDGDGDWKKLLAWVEGSSYSRENYSHLEAFFTSHGYSNRADEVFVHMKRRERREQFRWYSSFRWWSDLALDGLVRYGRAPERAFYWSILVLGVGFFVFRKRENVQPQRPEDASKPYNPLWYSLDLFTPAINLQAASVWMPRQDWTFGRNYAQLHRILGWILVPIGIAATAGLFK